MLIGYQYLSKKERMIWLNLKKITFLIIFTYKRFYNKNKKRF